jgi:hypothetical protein
MKKLMVLLSLVLLLVYPTAAGELAKAGPVLRWKVATDPIGDYVVTLAVGKDGTIYSGQCWSNSIFVLTPDGTIRQKLSVEKGVHALAVGRMALSLPDQATEGLTCSAPMAHQGRALTSGEVLEQSQRETMVSFT